MDKEKFKLRLDLKTGNEEIDLYIYELHNYIVSFETSSIKQMLISLDNIAFKITDDLDRICEGDLGASLEYDSDIDDFKAVGRPLSVLSDDKNSKVFDRIMTLISKIKDFKEVCEMAEGLRPEIAERKEEVKKMSIVIGPKDNPFETIQKMKLESKTK